jgi:hypothetical protein
MDTTTIVALAIWNALLFAALVAVVRSRRRLSGWITGADQDERGDREARDEEAWRAFLAEHPELRSLRSHEQQL